MKKGLKNTNGGFLQIIIAFVILVFILNHYHVTFAELWGWFVTAFNNVTK